MGTARTSDENDGAAALVGYHVPATSQKLNVTIASLLASEPRLKLGAEMRVLGAWGPNQGHT